ncbi:MAG TPA: hypothetical protein ACFYD4_08420 [Candidatus Wunengus sp. YC61]|uniref:hypothetical protein n=1 Tax=Candidatus Wunengus sp. YC61 TaxID=3367698 RepID=UPI004028083C
MGARTKREPGLEFLPLDEFRGYSVPGYNIGVGVDSDDLKRTVGDCLAGLRPREETVLRLRWGLDGEERGGK